MRAPGAGKAAGVTYVDAGGVHTWYDEHGAGDPLVLLHGGFSDASEFPPGRPQRRRQRRAARRDGRDHFPVVAAKIVRMASTEPTLTTADLARVTARTLVMAGDDDAIAPEHTLALYRGIADSELAVIPGTSHALIIEKPGLCNEVIVDFLTREPVPTYMPIRRLPSRPPSG